MSAEPVPFLCPTRPHPPLQLDDRAAQGLAPPPRAGKPSRKIAAPGHSRSAFRVSSVRPAHGGGISVGRLGGCSGPAPGLDGNHFHLPTLRKFRLFSQPRLRRPAGRFSRPPSRPQKRLGPEERRTRDGLRRIGDVLKGGFSFDGSADRYKRRRRVRQGGRG